VIALAGRLDVDHFGAEVGQHPTAKRRGNYRRALDDLQPLEGDGAILLLGHEVRPSFPVAFVLVYVALA
jgi:hypothetical protein